MIAYLSGKIVNKGAEFVIIEVNRIGYKVFINRTLYSELEIGQEIDLYTHQHIREDASDLYGFRSLEELEMFDLLISVSGIGPKSAIAVLGIAGVEDTKEAIQRGDSSLLTKVSGIGKKTAQRVVLELRGKVGSVMAGAGSSPTGAVTSSDEIDALMALGYSLGQARQALHSVDESIKDSGERIKQALKQINLN